ncbi:hypothetical protein Taro_048135, partial [Colocasia esculenta]|nr:hypothetical protein [Colocasia esculenta]
GVLIEMFSYRCMLISMYSREKLCPERFCPKKVHVYKHKFALYEYILKRYLYLSRVSGRKGSLHLGRVSPKEHIHKNINLRIYEYVLGQNLHLGRVFSKKHIHITRVCIYMDTSPEKDSCLGKVLLKEHICIITNLRSSYICSRTESPLGQSFVLRNIYIRTQICEYTNMSLGRTSAWAESPQENIYI